MDSKDIRTLLDKYWACETSLEEEKVLRTYFTQEQVAPELEEYRSLFSYFGKQQEMELSTGFSDQLKWELAKRSPAKRRKLWFNNIARVAASLLIILSCSYLYYNHYQSQQIKISLLEDTYQDPEIAYQEMKKALRKVSTKLNSGTKYMVSIKQINEGTKYFKTDQKDKK